MFGARFYPLPQELGPQRPLVSQLVAPGPTALLTWDQYRGGDWGKDPYLRRGLPLRSGRQTSELRVSPRLWYLLFWHAHVCLADPGTYLQNYPGPEAPMH